MVHGSVSLAKRRFHGLMRPMKLKAKVKMSRKATSSAPCLSEMTAVMTCWKSNSFDDVSCRNEIMRFMKCSKEAQLTSQRTSDGPKKWTNEEVNTRLRRFVWAQ